MRTQIVRQWTRLGLVVGLSLLAGGPAPAQQPGNLRVYFADVEGGQATLFVTPAGESLVVDAGWPGFNDRDADRIVALCKEAGISRIDNLLITHFHTDHVGGVPQLVAKVSVGRFIDHGANTETGDPATLKGWAAYMKVVADTHAPRLIVKPGDILPIKGVQAEVVSANGQVIGKALRGGGAGGQNAACAASPEKAPENTENDKSIGLLITFGKTRLLDLGDLTWAEERPLMCPVDKLGEVDIYVASHHGFDRSGSPALLMAIRPRVTIIDNGAHKGAQPAAWKIIEGTPRLKDIWQLHTAEDAGSLNVQEDHIANLPGVDGGHSIELTARADGSISVTNERTRQTVGYAAPSKVPGSAGVR